MVAAENVDIVFEVSLLKVVGSVREDFYPVFLIFLWQTLGALVVSKGLPRLPLARPLLFRAKERWDQLLGAFETALFLRYIYRVFCFGFA